MKLRNKKTGKWAIAEIVDDRVCLWFEDGTKSVQRFDTLSELNEEWEDYEEPNGYWYIDFDGDVLGCVESFDDETERKRKELGNYFETKEEAKKAVEKLKAWKRLKDAGFKFNNWIYDYREAEKINERGLSIGASYNQLSKIDADDINILFGGEE